VKNYIITRTATGALELVAEAEVIDKDSKGRSVGTHIDTAIAPSTAGFDIGNDSMGTFKLATFIMQHYMGAGGQDEAARRTKPFMEAFLIHHQLPPGARLEISSDVLDRFFSLQ
jgi:hypothetical protein